MDDAEDDTRYPPKHQSTYNSSGRSRFASRNSSYPTNNNNNNYRDDDDDENEYDDDGLDEDENRNYEDPDQDQDQDEDDQEYDDQSGYQRPIHPNGDSERRQKKRRLDNLVSNYEFAPRAAAKPSFTARNSPADWTEHATSVLLETWGDRFWQLGRKSLRSEDWVDVAEKVSEASKVERTETQCRTQLDTLKKKYKKEKTKIEEMGGGYSSKWVFFKNMDTLLNSSPRQQSGLACGIDSGEYVFTNPRVYLNRSNGLDEMRDSPGESESSEDDDDSDGLPPRRKGFGGDHDDDDDDDDDDGSSFRLLADSIQKFGEIYEKMESSKRQQMMELEKMRMDFQRDLEMQKKQILERAQAEIAKIQEGDDDDDDDTDTDGSAENLSG